MLSILRTISICLAALFATVPVAYAGGQAIVVTLPVFGLVVQQLAPEAQLTVLVKAHEDAHHVALTPQERLALARADFIVRAGAIEEGMDQVLSAPDLAGKTMRLDLIVADHKGWKADDLTDPAKQHFWFDPALMVPVMSALANRLADDGDALELADKMLRDLDQDIVALLAPFKGRGVVSLHDGLARYFARYGLVLLAREAHDHEAGMSAAEMSHLRHTLADHPGACLVADGEATENALMTLLAGTEAQALRFDFVGASYSSYREMMLALTSGLVQCFTYADESR